MKRALSTFAEIAERFAPEPQREENEEAGLLEPPSRSAPTAETRRGLPLKALTAAVIVGALIPTTILVALLWQGTMQTRNDGAGGFSAAAEPEIALSSPERIEAKAGEEIDFPLAIDATEKLPSRSVVAVSAMPDGASFSEGRPYGATGWSLRPDEIGELRFRLPNAQSGAFDMRIELLAADGAVLAQSETRLNVTAAPAEADTVSAVESSSFEQSAGVEAPKAPRLYQRRSVHLQPRSKPSKSCPSNLQPHPAHTTAHSRWARQGTLRPSGWRSSALSTCTRGQSSHRKR